MLTLQEIQGFMGGLSNWSLEGNGITKVFPFNNFKEAIEFLNKVLEICEKQNHYPDVIIAQGNVKLSLVTHSEKALTKADFDVAAGIDGVLTATGGGDLAGS